MHKEKLIEEVRKYSYLYDLSDSKYSDTIKKDEAWKQICSALKQPESECKKIWTNLRQSHRRAIKKNKTKSGQGATKIKKWIYEDEMSFLLPHYSERETISSIPSNAEDDDDSLFNDSDSQKSTIAQNECNQSLETLESAVEHKESSLSLVTPSPSLVKASKASKKKPADNNISASAVLMKYIVDGKQDKEDDAVDIFFKSIATTVKTFSDYNQAVIKSKIYNAVSTMELQEISTKQGYSGFGNLYGGQGYNSDYNQSIPPTNNIMDGVTNNSIPERQ